MWWPGRRLQQRGAAPQNMSASLTPKDWAHTIAGGGLQPRPPSVRPRADRGQFKIPNVGGSYG